MLGKLPKFHDDNLLVGIETSDDAAIYKVTEDIALIQTVDFFTPIVDDPYTFGQIAAANSLSDVYAMGGEPKIALNIVGFPNCLDPAILGDILAGGADKVKEAKEKATSTKESAKEKVAPSAKVNINKADAETLQKLSGIGEKKAQAIIDYRNKVGKIKSAAELSNIDGIGEATIEKITPFLSF